MRVFFEGGQSVDGVHGCNYMLAKYTDCEGETQQLYSEVIIPAGIGEIDADYYGYADLKADIISQAKERGFRASSLVFDDGEGWDDDSDR